MANVDDPRGLILVGTSRGSAFTARVRPYYIPSSYGTALFIGDPVVRTSTSNTGVVKVLGGGSGDPGTIAEINKCTAGNANPITGVIVGFSVNKSDLNQRHNPASTERVAFVCDDPDAEFIIQDDAAAVLAATAVGGSANLTFSTAGDTSTGKSGVELDASAIGTAADDQLQIVALDDRGKNALGANADWLVRINKHTEAHGAAGI